MEDHNFPESPIHVLVYHILREQINNNLQCIDMKFSALHFLPPGGTVISKDLRSVWIYHRYKRLSFWRVITVDHVSILYSRGLRFVVSTIHY